MGLLSRSILIALAIAAAIAMAFALGFLMGGDDQRQRQVPPYTTTEELRNKREYYGRF